MQELNKARSNNANNTQVAFIKVRGELGVKFNFMIPSLKFKEKINFFDNCLFGLFSNSTLTEVTICVKN
jgi:hypothetical protein